MTKPITTPARSPELVEGLAFFSAATAIAEAMATTKAGTEAHLHLSRARDSIAAAQAVSTPVA